jgi:hypothetical protein
MPLGFWINALHFSDGTRVPIPTTGVTVIVGPNNVGKSRSLKDVFRLCESSGATSPKVVKQIEPEGYGDPEEFLDRFQGAISSRNHLRYGQDLEIFGPLKARIRLDDLIKLLSDPLTSECGPLTPFFVTVASVEHRLSATTPPDAYDALDEAPTHPIQSLFSSEQLEQRVSAAFEKAFSVPLFVNRFSGKEITVHCGEPPATSPVEQYLTQCRKIPRLEEQGDGMRAFAGALFYLLTTRSFVVLLDEPEAFLHPPQARLLGTMLAGSLGQNKQVIVATHSGDVVRGLLDSATSGVTIIRLTREGEINIPSVLQPADIKRVWDDPALRFSNVLDGLFHEQVVLCEGEGDCRFFAAMLNALCESQGRRVPDVMFVSTNGKERLPVISSCLRQLRVPVTVIGDFDILRDSSLLAKVVSSQGGDWSALEKRWATVNSAVSQGLKVRTNGEVLGELTKLLPTEYARDPFTKTRAENCRGTLKVEGPWDRAKEIGLSAVPPSDATVAAKALLAELRSLRIFAIESGELESFDRSAASSKGVKWVNAVLEKDLVRAPELEAARRFVTDMFLQSPPSKADARPEPPRASSEPPRPKPEERAPHPREVDNSTIAAPVAASTKNDPWRSRVVVGAVFALLGAAVVEIIFRLLHR